MRIRVNGLPAPQGSKRHVGGGRMVESSRAVGPWREAVRAEAQRAVRQMVDKAVSQGHARAAAFYLLSDPETGARPAASVTVVFVLPRPRSHFGTGRNNNQVRPAAPRYPAKRPDVDKLARAVLDGLVAGGVMADDAQVCSLEVAKVWAANGQAVGAIIEVEAL